MHILLVEDNPADVLLLLEALEEHAVRSEVFAVNDGEKAIQYIDSIDERDIPRPELVILDLNLPKKSGHEVLQHLRASETCAEVRVVILSSSDAPHDREETARLGALHYICKPGSLDGYMKVGGLLKQVLQCPPQRLS